MPSPAFSSQLYSRLFPTGEVGRLFTDGAEVRAMMLVEGALAKVQGARGVIPEISGRAIHRASLELQLDPGGMAEETGANGVPVPALVRLFREAMQAPEHAQYLHWGATSQDIADTALMLRLRQVIGQYETALDGILSRLAILAEAHAELPMAGAHLRPARDPDELRRGCGELGLAASGPAEGDRGPAGRTSGLALGRGRNRGSARARRPRPARGPRRGARARRSGAELAHRPNADPAGRRVDRAGRVGARQDRRGPDPGHAIGDRRDDAVLGRRVFDDAAEAEPGRPLGSWWRLRLRLKA